MNNIELEHLKRNIKEYLGYSDEQINSIGVLSDRKLHAMKKDIAKIREKRENSSRANYQKNLAEKKIKQIIGGKKLKPQVPKEAYNVFFDNQEKQPKISTNHDKPRILFISDVKGWAWWIKSNYIKDYLSDEFDITVKYVVGNGCTPYNKIDQKYYDLYFTFGFSYIDFLNQVPKFKKVTGVTAHRAKNVIFPKMKIAGHVHANSMLLLKELRDMGFNKAYYLPNGVDENLFKPIKQIRKEGELIVGHVGKETPLKGQREYIIPAIKTCNVKSITNLRTWKDKLPHKEMPMLYNQMDVFVVSSVEDGTPNPALEAAACGRPIISNQIGNMPEFIKDGYNGFIVPRKIGAYVDKINYFKKNRSELIRMGNNARKTIEEGWTWKHQSKNYRNMFRDIFIKI
jgi:glycosyltransferase involved in cell wall biosynthesis